MSFSLCLEPSYGTHGFSDAWFGAIPRLCLGTGCPAGRIVPGMVRQGIEMQMQIRYDVLICVVALMLWRADAAIAG